MRVKDGLDQLGDAAASRRGFLKATGLTALLGAGMLASEAAMAAPAPTAPTGELPADAAASLRMLRSLTLLALSSSFADRSFGAKVQDGAVRDLAHQVDDLIKAGGASVGYTPNPDDDTPPHRPWWWPWPWPWPPFKFKDFGLDERVIPAAGLAALDMMQSLTLYNAAALQADGQLARTLQTLALDEVKTQLGAIQRSGTLAAWEPGDDICPPWWPFPWRWPRPRPYPPLTEQVNVLHDLLRSVEGYAQGAAMFDSKLSGARRAQLQKPVAALSRKVGSFGTLASWEPGDDICPPWWPWPWPRPHRLIDMLDPLERMDEPEPWPWLEASKDIIRAGTVFAIASRLQDQGLAESLQTAALEQIGSLGQKF